MRKFLDRLQSVGEFALAAVFIFAAINLIGYEAVIVEGVVVAFLGGKIAVYFYMFWFFSMGAALLYAKLRKRKSLHKHVLMAMYLTAIYTITLSTAFFGFSLASIADDLIIGVIAAAAWLRWKFRTEYIDPAAFQKMVEKHRDDLPMIKE